MFYLHIASPVVGLVIYVFTQVTGYRYAKRWGLLRWVFTGFAGGFVALLSIEMGYSFTAKSGFLESMGQITLSTVTYIALGYGYFHFINLGETARRVRILIELWESDDGLSRNEILERYDAAHIVKVRLQRMINKRQIVVQNDRYYIGKPIMLYIAEAIVMMKVILLGRTGEFR
jgi:hypothetical protein